MWAGPGGIKRPWDWRHGTRRPGQAATPSTAPSASAGGYRGRKLTCWKDLQLCSRSGAAEARPRLIGQNGDGVACESLR